MFENYHIAAKEFANGDMAVYGRLMFILNTYGIENIELEGLNSVEKLFFTSVKASINRSLEISEKRKEAGKKGGISKKQTQNNLLKQNNFCLSEEEVEEEREYEEEIENEYEKEREEEREYEEEIENEYEKEREEEREDDDEYSENEFFSSSPSSEDALRASNLSKSQENYAQIIFSILCKAEFPHEKDIFQFMNGSFYRSLSLIHKAHLHSDDVIQALKNYIQVFLDPTCYPSRKYNFELFVKSKEFEKCLPQNFDVSLFKNYQGKNDGSLTTKTNTDTAITYDPDSKCPACGEKVFWTNDGKLECINCHKKYRFEELNPKKAAQFKKSMDIKIGA